MTTPTIKFDPSAPLENNGLEQRFEKKMNVELVLLTQLLKLKKILITLKIKIIYGKRDLKFIKHLPQG